MPTSRIETFDSLNVNIAILDPLGIIVSVNDAWKRFGTENGLRDPQFCLGMNYLDVCRNASAAPGLIRDLEDLLQDRRATVARWYPCHAPAGRRWFVLFGFHQKAREHDRTVLLHIEATELLGPEGIDRLERERPDFATAPTDVEHTIEAALMRLLPAALMEVDPGGLKQEPPGRLLQKDEARAISKALTKRQFEVLLQLGAGKSNGEIAEALDASPSTIKLHVGAILKRLELRTRAQAQVLGSRLEASGW